MHSKCPWVPGRAYAALLALVAGCSFACATAATTSAGQEDGGAPADGAAHDDADTASGDAAASSFDTGTPSSAVAITVDGAAVTFDQLVEFSVESRSAGDPVNVLQATALSGDELSLSWRAASPTTISCGSASSALVIDYTTPMGDTYRSKSCSLTVKNEPALVGEHLVLTFSGTFHPTTGGSDVSISGDADTPRTR